MARRYDNSYSRLVAWLKILLPLAALVLLSTLFLVSRRIMPTEDLPYTIADAEQIAREQRLSAPRYSGVTDDGSSLNVTAAVARPEGDTAGEASAETLTARLKTVDGVTTDVASDAGRLDTPGNRLNLSGNVRITTSSGLVVTSQALDAALDRTLLESPGPVEGHAPMGDITAGNLRMTSETGSYVAVFKGGVKLIYLPQTAGSTGAPPAETPAPADTPAAAPAPADAAPAAVQPAPDQTQPAPAAAEAPQAPANKTEE